MSTTSWRREAFEAHDSVGQSGISGKSIEVVTKGFIVIIIIAVK